MQAQKQPEVVQQLASTGTIPLILGSDDLKTYMAAEVAKWVRLAREANIQPE
jgi:tripartite-type tricarboxylate transporter receptor subunit TctC